jgi:eukaryotic-like serine/threonine-protein kinase
MASIVPGFEYDIFISYRQKDNKYDGWVTEFIDNLKKELEATFKEDVSIYFDSNAHDGLLETHNVNKSLEGKLKSLIFIPILSQTYCDPKSFAWTSELLPFLKTINHDQFGKSVKLANGNIADRFLPVRIHDLDEEDRELFESITQSVLRPVDFIYRLPGVNRQLRAKDDEQIKSANQILYRDQINKVAHAIKDIISAIKNPPGAAKISSEPKKEVASKPMVKHEVSHIENQKTPSKTKYIAWVVLIVLLVAVGIWFVPQYQNKQRAKNELLPAIQKLVDENFGVPTSAFEMALEAEKYISNDSALIKLWAVVSTPAIIETEPAGAQVWWKDYNKPDDPWRLAGVTPLDSVRFPRGFLRVEIRKDGFQTIEWATFIPFPPAKRKLKLDSTGSLPENMVRIPSQNTSLNIVGLEQTKPVPVGSFLVDRFEVSHKQFKAFVDAGGYSDEKFWRHSFTEGGKQLSWKAAMTKMVDRTGRPGPATWEAGIYADGEENHPVTGVSWYEAAAYAEFAKKQLPSVFHWGVVAATGRTEFIVPMSNFNGTGTTPVGSLSGYSSRGIYDLAGNVREWCWNESGDRNQKYILGGAYNDPTFAFNDTYMQQPFDRSPTNGFRCIQELPGDTTMNALVKPVHMAFRDYRKEKPVDDKTFEIFARLYAYDNVPLQEKIEATLDRELWTIEKISFEAGYNKERMQAYIFLPKNIKPPYQPILFFPGSGDIYSAKYNPDLTTARLDFLLKGGRALVVPIYKGTHERQDELNTDLQEETAFYRDHVIMWRKDVGRTIDYLETRKDMQVDKLGYFGWSWGGFMGGIIPALEKRFKAVVLNVGGMEMNRALPEADQLNFLPRVKQPILMLNGKHDMFFPVETSQKPMFDYLGTAKDQKQIIIFDAGHLVPKNGLAKETLAWFDKYLGVVK